jgi:hypothetical protein
MIGASPLPFVGRVSVSVLTAEPEPLGGAILARLRAFGWTIFAEKADPPSRLAPRHLCEFAGSTLFSRKMVRESE